jgi:hypothetical protein
MAGARLLRPGPSRAERQPGLKGAGVPIGTRGEIRPERTGTRPLSLPIEERESGPREHNC